MSDFNISRRSFLGSAAALAASSVVPSALANSVNRKMERTLQKNPILGHGDFTYECVHDWLTPPSNVKWGDTHGLALDSQSRIYVAHTVHSSSVGSDAVCVYDQKGKFIESWGAEFRGGAHGLDLRKEGSEEFLYHCDTRRRLVVKTNLKGKVIWQKGWPQESGVYASEDKWCPTNVAFDPNGDLFVGDGYGSSYIHRYGIDGTYKGVVIKPGAAPGQVQQPHGLWVDSRDGNPKLAVADRANARIQYFTLDGKHLGFITHSVRRPCHIHYNHGLMLVPDLDSVVTIFDKDDQPVAMLGDGQPMNPDLRDVPREQFIPGKFVHPHAAIWINPKDILVAEWVPIGRVTLLRKV